MFRFRKSRDQRKPRSSRSGHDSPTPETATPEAPSDAADSPAPDEPGPAVPPAREGEATAANSGAPANEPGPEGAGSGGAGSGGASPGEAEAHTGAAAPGDGDPEPAPAREATPDERVTAALQAWRTELLELAGGSALWDIDALGDAIVDLTGAHPSGIAQLYAGRRTRLSNVVREGSALSLARRQARIVQGRSEELAQQFGIAPTYVAMGVARWFMADDPKAARSELDMHTPEGRIVQVPVLLRPVRLHSLPGNTDIDLELDPQVEVNPVLVRALRLHGVQIDPAVLAASTNREHGFTPRPALDAVSALGGSLTDFTLDSRIIVGTFVHPGQALAEDLESQHDLLHRHEVVRALAGAGEDLASRVRPVPSRRLVDPDPNAERGIGDLDSAQHQVLDAIGSGSHLLIDTPPGVDGAGTVAAIIAEAAKNNHSLLYVPGTRRAGAGVLDALRELGADELVLDLNTDPQWRKTAAARLVDGLNPPIPEPAPTLAEDRAALAAARTTLGEFIGALHLPRDPWGVSANRVLHELAELTSQRPGPRTQVRLPADTVRGLGTTNRDRARATLIRAAELGAFHLRASDTPWYGARLRNADHAAVTLTRVQTLAGDLPHLLDQVAATAAQTGVDEARTLDAWGEQLRLLDGISAALDVFTPEVFERSAKDMVIATATPAWRAEQGIDMPAGMRRRLRRQARDLIRPGVVPGDLHAELVTVSELRDLWRRHCSGGGWPRLPEEMAAITRTYRKVATDVSELNEALRPTVAGRDLGDLPLAELTTRMHRLASDESTVASMPERADCLADLERWGLDQLTQDLLQRRVSTGVVGAEFDLAWWSSVLEEMLLEDPAMVALDPAALDTALADLRRLDAAHTESLTPAVLAAHAHNMRAAIAAHRSQAQEFYRAIAQRGELDLRHLVESYPDIVWHPRPAWIIPPMVVPQVLPPGQQVDLVIIDAVHRLGPEYLLPALVRGRQVVVLTDVRRPGSQVADLFAGLPRISLPTDRADRNEPIARFLAAHGYAEVIQPVPSPPQFAVEQSLSLDVVDGVGMPALDSKVVESVQDEVNRVVDLVIDHALSHPDQSLAVIALNPRHAERVREAVAHTASNATSVAEFFNPAVSEAFTVVSVDEAAGMRRDAIILTAGFGKTAHGRVMHRFGAISGPHGAGLLVDAIDAARERLTVVSCFDHDALDPYRLRSDGAYLLRDLLEYASTSGAAPAAEEDDADPDRLLVDLAERLWRLGLTVVPNYGAPGTVPIPLALGHPSRPGELLMALLTDDPTYVNESSLRRRDRHWPERLTARGWHARTVFSTAVFMDPQGEAERIAAEVAQIAADLGGEASDGMATPPAVVLDGAEDLLTQAEVAARAGTGPAAPVSAAPPPVRVSQRGETMAGQPTMAVPVYVAPGERSERPPLQKGLPISGYSDDQLDALLAWIASDGKARTDEQLHVELRSELGVDRRSAHTYQVLQAAIARAAQPGPRQPDPVPRPAPDPEPSSPAAAGAGDPAAEPESEPDSPAADEPDRAAEPAAEPPTPKADVDSPKTTGFEATVKKVGHSQPSLLDFDSIVRGD